MVGRRNQRSNYSKLAFRCLIRFGSLPEPGSFGSCRLTSVSDLKRSCRFYGPLFEYLGYERADYDLEGEWAFEDWKRWLEGTPHEISIVQAHGDEDARAGVNVQFSVSSRLASSLDFSLKEVKTEN